MRSRCDRDEIERRTALGIAASLDARRIEDKEDRVRETEEMSTVGLEVSLEEKAKTLRILKQQRKQIEIKENTSKFGKVKLGVHGEPLPPFASNLSKLADHKIIQAYD